MARRPSRRVLLGLAALALLVAAVAWYGLHIRRERQLEQAWQELAALAAEPPAQPAGTVTAARFARDLALFIHDEDPTRAEPFAAWLRAPGPHHLRSASSPELGDMVRYGWDLKDRGQVLQSILEGAGRRLANTGDPDLLPGLLELAARLRREGGWRELDTGLDLTRACLHRLDALGDEAPPIPAAWAPTQDEVRHARAVAAVTLVDRVAAGRFHASSTPIHPETDADALAAELRRQLVVDPTVQAPRATPAGRLDALIASLFGPAREEAAALRRQASDGGRAALPAFVEVRQRWRQVLGPLPDAEGPDDE